MSLHEHDRIQERLRAVADPVGFLINLFAHAPVGFAVWSADGRPLLTNKAFMDLFGAEPPPDYNVLKDDILAANGMLALFERAFAGETVQVPTFWFDPRDLKTVTVTEGRRVAISMTIFPLFRPSGEIEYVAATYKDETEITRTADQLRLSEERVRLAQQAARVGTFEWDIQSGANRWTTELEAMYGLAPGEFGATQQSWERLVHPDDRADAVKLVERAFETLLPVEGEWRVVWPDGSVHWVFGRFQVIQDREGKPQRLIGVNLDISERKKEDEVLRRSERRFRGFQESGIIGIVLADLAGNITEANDAFLEIVGYTRDDFAAGRVSGQTLNTPDLDRTDAAARRELLATGVAHVWEKELVRKDGSRVAVLSGVVMLDETSQESVAFVLDLTALKRAQAAGRESDAYKSAVMEAALDAIVLMDHEGRISEFNAAAERTFGYARHEVVGKLLADTLIPAPMRAPHAAGLARYLATGVRRVLGTRTEVEAIRKDGTVFPAEVAVVRILAEGAPMFTGYIRDITERRQAAEAELLRREKEAAQAANAELEAFSYSVAHDLRAPLRGISGFSAALLEDYSDKLDDEARRLVRRVMASASRMGQIIDALLSLARLSRSHVQRESVDLTQIATAVGEEHRANEPGRVVRFTVAGGVVVRGDARLLRMVMENLLANAWKFTRRRDEARIEFGCEPAGESAVRCYVRDNGAGFDAAFADKLFMPFQRLHSAEQFEGTGVGLATVLRIIHRHGGRVGAEGIVGQGATFSFTIPTG